MCEEILPYYGKGTQVTASMNATNEENMFLTRSCNMEINNYTVCCNVFHFVTKICFNDQKLVKTVTNDLVSYMKHASK